MTALIGIGFSLRRRRTYEVGRGLLVKENNARFRFLDTIRRRVEPDIETKKRFNGLGSASLSRDLL